MSGGKCLKDCTIGNNYLCKSCNPEPGKIDKCFDCNEGYFIPKSDDYYQNQCSRCPTNCKKCNGIYNSNQGDCIECDTGYYLSLYEENEYSYYYSNPTYYYICLPCNIPGCTQYKTNSNKCICISCNTPAEGRIKNGDENNEYTSCYSNCTIGEFDRCKSCGSISGQCGECNEGYSLNSQGKCINNYYHMFAKYRTTKENEYVKLMAYSGIIKMTINGTVVSNPRNYYTFPLPGEHSIYIRFSSVNFMDLFYEIKHLIYIEFLPQAKSLSLNYMNE